MVVQSESSLAVAPVREKVGLSPLLFLTDPVNLVQSRDITEEADTRYNEYLLCVVRYQAISGGISLALITSNYTNHVSALALVAKLAALLQAEQ